MKSIIKRAQNKFFPPYKDRRLNEVSYSFSQCGEDRIASYVFELRGVKHPSYIDIGANLPWHYNNTALFYHYGSTGISIEPNPVLIEGLINERPLDVNLNIGVGPKKEMLDFYILSDPTLSTFSTKELENFLKNGFELVQTVKVPVVTLSEILDKHFNGFCPDFMSLDVEGMELDILSSFDLRGKGPKIVCVETAEYSSRGDGMKRGELIEFIISNGYFLYADTNLNSILVQKTFWN
jgi:FkbM family methyltransferase